MLLKVLQCTEQPSPYNKELSGPKVEQGWSGHLREVDWGAVGLSGDIQGPGGL